MERLGRYAGVLLNSCHKKLQKTNLHSSKRDIHNLRLNLKEIFALLTVVDLCLINVSVEFHQAVKVVRKLFKLTGVVRDNQLIVKHAKQFLTFESYKNLKKISKGNIKDAKLALEQNLQQINIQQIRQDLILGFKETAQIRTNMVVSHLKHRVKKDQKRIEKELSRKKCDYHLVRRWVKEQYFLLKTLKDVLYVNIGYSKLVYKESLGKALGEWHDWVVLENKLLFWGIVMDDSVKEKVNRMSNRILNKAVKMMS